MTEAPDMNTHQNPHHDESKKDFEEDPVIVGIDTRTHTHKYVPVQGPRGPFLGLFHKKQENVAHRVKSRGEALENQHEEVGE